MSPIASHSTLSLTCSECCRAWELERRPGIYPSRCPACRRAERDARHIATRARERGLRACAVRHERRGWVCVVACFGESAILRDIYDIDWVLAEIQPVAVAA